MTKVAVIEDDLPTSNQLAGWIKAARPDVTVEQWFTRDDAEAGGGRARASATTWWCWTSSWATSAMPAWR
jgi:hypothetical protein